MGSNNQNTFTTIDLNLDQLEAKRSSLQEKWQEFFEMIDDNYKFILNNITSPMCGKISMVCETAKKKPKETPARSKANKEFVLPVVVNEVAATPAHSTRSRGKLDKEALQTTTATKTTRATEAEAKTESLKKKEENAIASKKVESGPSDMDEWMTDDEDDDGDVKTAMKSTAKSPEAFYDALDQSRLNTTTAKRKLQSSMVRPPSTVKAKKKKVSQYFTPQSMATRTIRASTRSKARIAHPKLMQNCSIELNTSKKRSTQTPKPSGKSTVLSTPSTASRTMVTRQMVNVISSSESNSSLSSVNKYGSCRTGNTVSRTKVNNEVQECKPRFDMKALTESAAKRRRDEEERRRMRLEVSKEKEQRVLEQRQQLLQKKVMEQKQRSAEKMKRIELVKEQQRKENEERIRREMQKREEEDFRRKQMEEEKREMIKKRQEILLNKQKENEQRKIDQEEKERQAKLAKQEEIKKRQELLKEKFETEGSLNAMIQQHNKNTSLQQKAITNSFLKKVEATTKTQENGTQEVKTEIQNSTFTKSAPETDAPKVVEAVSKVPETKKQPEFLHPKEVVQEYEDNYDISEVKSDDDSDEDHHNSKPIPKWAKGNFFLAALKEQYNKHPRVRLRESLRIFPSVDLPVDLGIIFEGQRAVIAKYSKRTSSAFWNSPPANHFNISNISMSRSMIQE